MEAEAIAKVDERILKEEQKHADEVAKLLEKERLEQEKLAEEKAKLEAEKKKKKIVIDTIPLIIHD